MQKLTSLAIACVLGALAASAQDSAPKAPDVTSPDFWSIYAAQEHLSSMDAPVTAEKPLKETVLREFEESPAEGGVAMRVAYLEFKDGPKLRISYRNDNKETVNTAGFGYSKYLRIYHSEGDKDRAVWGFCVGLDECFPSTHYIRPGAVYSVELDPRLTPDQKIHIPRAIPDGGFSWYCPSAEAALMKPSVIKTWFWHGTGKTGERFEVSSGPLKPLK
jgi:hypothetical protein